jgi:hypothetical protein
LGLAGVVWFTQDRLKDQVCRRGLDVPGLKCPSKKKSADEEKSEESTLTGEKPEEVTDGDAPESADGIVFSFPEHAAEGVYGLKLDCDDHPVVEGRWWASVDATEEECKIIILPSRKRVSVQDLTEGQYVCSGGQNPACERRP